MGKVIIDGKTYEFEGKRYLLQFALDNGVDIPYFCYHPAMSLPTNCRMCLVETGMPVINRETQQPELDENGNVKIMWGRKPSTACNTPLADGMHVKTHKTSKVVEKAQKGVLEFMLINHPLDCPICDQAGECPLQINTYRYGPEGSRFELEKVHKPKRVHLGPRVVLDAERCINCTRCVRFTEEISQSHQLTIISRGDKNFPAAAPGLVFDDPYSMNVIDICPVGALTSESFRFKARVWEMNYTPSVCTSCSNNCSVDVWVRDNQVMRLTPRENPAVNQYWMCDEGRLNISWLNENRVSGAKAKGDTPLSMEEALNGIKDLLNQHKGKILFIGSAFATLENQYALKQFANALGVNEVFYVKHVDSTFGDNFLKKNDRTPNAAGAEWVGFKSISMEELSEKVQKTGIELVYIVEDDKAAEALSPYASSKVFIVHGYNYVKGYENFTYLLPAATHTEQNGVFINEKQIPQITLMARQIKRMTPEMWMALPKSRLDAGGQSTDNWRNPEHIIDCLPSWMFFAYIQPNNKELHNQNHIDIFNKIKSKFAPIRDLKLPKRQRKEAFKMSQLEFAQR